MTTPATILCVDDDADLLAAIVRSLRRDRHQVLSTTSALEAASILTAQPVAVLVSDFDMPEMTGVELCAAARKIRPETVRILLTGRGTFDTAVKGINEGEIFRFLSKPFDPEQLRRTVVDAIARHGELAAAIRDRDTTVRRERLMRELEDEYPHITQVARDPKGAYVVGGDPWTRLAGLGLDHVRALARR